MDAMTTARLEAFSDGVFAIAITLLVLEFSVDTATKDLGKELLHIWPSYLAYATSFLTIGVIWVNHHALFNYVVARRSRAPLPQHPSAAGRRVHAVPDAADRRVPAGGRRTSKPPRSPTGSCS